jgi:hypothetical protein
VKAFMDAIGDPETRRTWAGLFDEIAKGFTPADQNEHDDDPDDGFEHIKVD